MFSKLLWGPARNGFMHCSTKPTMKYRPTIMEVTHLWSLYFHFFIFGSQWTSQTPCWRH